MLATDLTFSRQGDSAFRSVFKLFRGALGILSTVWAFCFTLSTYNQRLLNEGLEDADTNYSLRLYGGLAVALIGDAVTLTGALKRFYDALGQAVGRELEIEMTVPSDPENASLDEQLASEPTVSNADNVPISNLDIIEMCVLTGVAYASLGLIGLEGYALAASPEFQEDKNHDGNLREAGKLLAARSISFSVVRLGGWMFTQSPAGAALTQNPYIRATVIGTRAAANVSGLICHCIAGFDDLT